MALDKVVDSALLNADLQAVADAIRAKGGTGDALAFPEGFLDAIQAISAGGGNGLAYDIGTFTLSEDVASNQFTNPEIAAYSTPIPHNLGEVPDCVMVWTDHFAGLTADDGAPYTTSTMVGFMWLNGLTGMICRASSTANLNNPILIMFYLNANDYRISAGIPTSTAYGYPNSKWLPTDEYFRTSVSSATTWWRGGAQYNYFVSKAWWNVGGVESVE